MMNELHKRDFLKIKRETTALFTQRQGFQELWLLVLSLGAQQCHGCEIPSTFWWTIDGESRVVWLWAELMGWQEESGWIVLREDGT